MNALDLALMEKYKGSFLKVSMRVLSLDRPVMVQGDNRDVTSEWTRTQNS